MRLTTLGVALGILMPGAAFYACGSSDGANPFGNPDGSASSSGGGDGGLGGDNNLFGTDGAWPEGYVPPFEDGGFSSGDCDGGGCAFPPQGAQPCANAPAINLV